jgi:hypothetical protein
MAKGRPSPASVLRRGAFASGAGTQGDLVDLRVKLRRALSATESQDLVQGALEGNARAPFSGLCVAQGTHLEAKTFQLRARPTMIR